MIKQSLIQGTPVFYTSTGHSMWPVVQSGDACSIHPIQAVTAEAGTRHGLTKEASEIVVGDIVFCQVQPNQLLYAHPVIKIVWCHDGGQAKYWIGNVAQKYNGWCYREHIYGILVRVDTEYEGMLYTRPFPKSVYHVVLNLLQEGRWNKTADKLCQPDWNAPFQSVPAATAQGTPGPDAASV